MTVQIRRAAAVVLSLALLSAATGCVRLRITKEDLAVKLFKDRATVCFSNEYADLDDKNRDGKEPWEQGMLSGNGTQGFITTGAPFSDIFIFQNTGFVLPAAADDGETEPADDEETVRKAIAARESYDGGSGKAPSAAPHPAGVLRIDGRTEEKQKLRSYLRYTDYETGEVGERYSDNLGMWERVSFTSFADDAVFTSLSSPSGKKLFLTLSFEDPSVLSGYGAGREADCRYKTWCSANGDCLAFIGRYPEDGAVPAAEADADEEETAKTAGRGWATVVYVITDGGSTKRVPAGAEGAPADAVRIEGAYAAYLITRSVPLEELGNFDAFAQISPHREIRDLRAEAARLAEKYEPNGYFDYAEALDAHLQLYQPQFLRTTLTLGETDNDMTNEALLKKQRAADRLNATLQLRNYYAARYALLCSAGAPRGSASWTGAFRNDAGTEASRPESTILQNAALSTASMPLATAGYAAFLLRQAPVWEACAAATHGFTQAIQAPCDGATADPDAAAAASRYYNAGATILLRPLFEAWQTGEMAEIPLPADLDVRDLATVLSLTDEPLSEYELEELEERGTLDLRDGLLLPLLQKAANYWLQLLTPSCYTTKDGRIRLDEDKTSLEDGESYCILPGATPEGAPKNYDGDAAANATLDVAACRDCLEMFLAVNDAAGAELDTEAYEEALGRLPSYQKDKDGALSVWATTLYEAAESVPSGSLYCLWPGEETRSDADLRDAASALLRRGAKDNSARTLIRRALFAARLGDNKELTESLLTLESGGFRSDSLQTTDGARGTEYAAAYLTILQEALVYAAPGEISLLPCVPLSGFHVGSVEGLPTRAGATVTLMTWDLEEQFVIADITSPTAQTIVVSSPISDDTEILEFTPGQTRTVKLDLNIEVEPESTQPAETATAPLPGDDTAAGEAGTETETEDPGGEPADAEA